MAIGTPPGSLILANPSGWMNTELFVSVMDHFIKQTQSSSANPSLLLLDNHESHLNIEALDLAKKFGVTVLTFHPHTSDKMQPLDVGVFGPFKTYYNNAMDSWLLRIPGHPVSIYDIGQFIGTAFTKSMTIENITKSFRKTGIFPFDRDVFSNDDFLPSTVTDRQDPTCSALDQISLVTNDILPPVDTDPTPALLNPNPAVPDSVAAGPANSKTILITPDQFRAPIKAGPRNNKRKARRSGRSIIATDTPEKDEINKIREAAVLRKRAKVKKVKRQVLLSDSEGESENERNLCQDSDDDDDWYEKDEDEENEHVLTEREFLMPIPRRAEVGEYVVVLFCTKKLREFYIAKILEPLNDNMEYFVTFLRLKLKTQQLFCMPDVADTAFVKEEDVKYLLPKPKISGSARRQSYYKFRVSFASLDMR